jgi:hypothetical protein
VLELASAVTEGRLLCTKGGSDNYLYSSAISACLCVHRDTQRSRSRLQNLESGYSATFCAKPRQIGDFTTATSRSSSPRQSAQQRVASVYLAFGFGTNRMLLAGVAAELGLLRLLIYVPTAKSTRAYASCSTPLPATVSIRSAAVDYRRGRKAITRVMHLAPRT